MVTPAERYSNKMDAAQATKPTDFQIGAKTVAFVTADGKCRLVGSELDAAQAKLLRDWIKVQFMDGVVQ